MTRTCAICSHKDERLINQLIISGEAERSIAKQYGISASSVHRHKGHIQDLIQRDNTLHANDIIGRMRALQDKTLAILECAESKQDNKIALQAVKEARCNFELIAKLTGQLEEKLAVVDNRQVYITYVNDWRKTDFIENG